MNRSFLILLGLVIFLGAGFGGSFVGGVIYGQTLQDDAEAELSPRLGAVGAQSPGGGPGRQAGQRGQGRRGADAPAGVRAGQSEATAAEIRAEDGQRDGVQRPAAAAASASPGQPEAGTGPGRRGATPAAAGESAPATDSDSQPSVSATTDRETGAGPAPNSSGGAANAQTARGGVAGTVQALEGDVLTITTPRGDVAVTLSEDSSLYQAVEATREAFTAGVTVRVTGDREPEGGISAGSVLALPEGAENLFGPTGGRGNRQRGR